MAQDTFAGLTDVGPESEIPVVDEGLLDLRLRAERVRHDLQGERDEDRFRRRITLGLLLIFVALLIAGITYGAANADYEPVERWMAYVGPWAGFGLRMVWESRRRGRLGRSPPV